MQGGVVLFAVVLLVLSLPDVFAAQKDNKWMVDTLIPGLIRINANGDVVSSDLSDYIKFNCTGSGKKRKCNLDDDNLKVSKLDELYAPSSEDTIQSYGSGVMMYAAVSFIGAILLIFGTCTYLSFKFICGGIGICCMLIRRKKYKTSMFSKPVRHIATAILTGTFFAFLAAVIIICYSVGIQEAFSAISEAVDVPRGVAQITYSMSRAMQPAFIGIVSTVMLPTLRDVNATLCEVVNWEGVINDLKNLSLAIDHLPDLHNVKKSLESLDNTTTLLKAKITQIENYNDDFQTRKLAVLNESDVLLANLDRIQTSLDEVSDSVDVTYVSIVDLQDAWTDLYGADGPETYDAATDQDGLIDSVQYDIARTDRDDTVGEGIPTSATLNDAATGATASMARLLSEDLDGDSSETSSLVDKLQAIYASIVALPDFDATADNLVAVNDAIDALTASDGPITMIPLQLQAIQDSIDALPSAAVVKNRVAALFDAIDAMDANSLTNLLEQSDSLINSIPDDIDDIIAEIDKLSAVIDEVRPIIKDLMIDQTAAFNRTIMELPINTTKFYNTIDDIMVQASDTADDLTPTFDDLKDTIRDSVDLTGFIDQIDTANDEYTTAVNRTALDLALDAADITIAYDAAAYDASLAVIATAMQAAIVPLSVVDGFRALSVLVTALNDDLSTAVGSDGEYLLLEKGLCTNTAEYCTTDSTCGSDTCDHIAESRCRDVAFQACTSDGDCTDTTCLADSTRAANLQASLTALADPDVSEFDQASTNSAFSALRTASASLNIEQLASDVGGVSDDLAAADTTPFSAQIVSMQDTLNGDDLDFSPYLSGLTSAKESANGIDVGDFSDQLDDLQKKIDTYGDKLDDYIGFAEDLQKFMFNSEGLKMRLGELDEDNLNAVLDENGFGPVLMSVGQTFESTSDDVIAILRNNTFKQKRVEMTKSLREPARYMDRATANPHRGFYEIEEVGALYYMMQLSNASAKLMVDAHDPTADTIVNDQDGSAYPDNKYCLTRDCFENQQTELQAMYGQMLPVLIVLPVIVALLALFGFVLLFLPAKGCGCCRWFVPRWMLCMIIAIVPWYLIFSGFFFSFFIGISDGCRTGPKIAANYITSYGDDLCIKLDGNGTLTECDIRGNGLDVTVNILKVSNIALGLDSCSGNNDDDPFFLPLSSLANQLRNSTNDRTQREIDKKAYRKYRQRPKSIVSNFAVGSAVVARDFVEDIGDDVFTCENVGDVIDYFTNPVCYSIVGPWTWIASTIYLAAWAMCCLGIPAGCALKNTFKWDAREARHAKEEAAKKSNGGAEGAMAMGGRLKNDLLKYHMLALRNRGPLVGRTISLPRVLIEDEDDDQGEDGHHHHGGHGGHGGHAQEGRGASYTSVDGGDDDGEGKGVAYPSAEAQAAPPGGGYIARYPKISAKHDNAEKYVAEGAAEEQEDGGEEGEDGRSEDSDDRPLPPARQGTMVGDPMQVKV